MAPTVKVTPKMFMIVASSVATLVFCTFKVIETWNVLDDRWDQRDLAAKVDKLEASERARIERALSRTTARGGAGAAGRTVGDLGGLEHDHRLPAASPAEAEK